MFVLDTDTKIFLSVFFCFYYYHYFIVMKICKSEIKLNMGHFLIEEPEICVCCECICLNGHSFIHMFHAHCSGCLGIHSKQQGKDACPPGADIVAGVTGSELWINGSQSGDDWAMPGNVFVCPTVGWSMLLMSRGWRTKMLLTIPPPTKNCPSLNVSSAEVNIF